MIKGLFYSQFDNTLGPKIIYQYPDNLLSPEVFDAISEFIITKSSLCGRIVSLLLPNHNSWVIGVPVCLSHSKYPRNALIFNLSFIVDCNHPHVNEFLPSIENCAFKLSNYLSSLEKEREYIFRRVNNFSYSSETINNNSSQSLQNSRDSIKDEPNDCRQFPSLISIMESIVTSLNQTYSCEVNIDESNTIYLKLTPSKKMHDIEMNHLVPIPIMNGFDIFNTKQILEIQEQQTTSLWKSGSDQTQMDIGMKRLLPYIDGKSYVGKIIAQSDMSQEIVIKAIKHLLYYDCVKLVDIFEYSNIYTVLPTIRNLYEDKNLQAACIFSVTFDPNRPLPKIGTIFKIYSKFRPNVDVKSICLKYKLRKLNIDVQRLINFGILKKLIRLVRKYPLTLVQNDSNVNLQTLEQFTDGKHSFDQIAVFLGVPKSELDRYFDEYMYV